MNRQAALSAVAPRDTPLSEAASRFLDFVAREPAAARRESYRVLDEENPLPDRRVQSWPTLVDREFLGEAARVNLGLAALVRSAPARLLGGDPGRIAGFYGMDPGRAALVGGLVRQEGRIDAVIGRGDYLLDATGLRCVEFNMSGRLGGWRVGLWRKLYEKVPVLRRFFEEEGIEHRITSPARTLLRHLLSVHRSKHGDTDGFQVMLAVRFRAPWEAAGRRYFEAELDGVMEEEAPGTVGRLAICSYSELDHRGDGLYHDGHKVDAVIDQGDDVDRAVFLCWMAGQVAIYNPVIDDVLSDKRTLALLSESADEGSILDEEERRLVRGHVPWTRLVRPGATTFRGEEADLAELLRRERGDLVLKAGRGYGGEQVILGSATTQEEWEQGVAAALAAGDWVAQERVEAPPLLYQDGEEGHAEHDVVWGLFAWGAPDFAGGYLRMLPRRPGGGMRVVNAKRGASEGLIFEVGGG
ncbi:MAG TPA: hypothetical protein VF150_09360 [Thermoanaerobaculia bacterium]